MKTIIPSFIAVVLIAWGISIYPMTSFGDEPTSAPAVTKKDVISVRGLILDTQSPVNNVPVTLKSATLGQSGRMYSGTDGMYYFYNVPAGQYTLQVWAVPNGRPLLFTITVRDGLNDVAPIDITQATK